MFGGREHVIPQGFGTFEPVNMVLKCVCDSCNNQMGQTIDRKLANDSIEGIDRIRLGIKDAREFQSLGRRSTLRVEFTGGELKGRSGYPVPSMDDARAPAVVPFPHVSIHVDGEDEPIIRKPEELPTLQELRALYQKASGFLIQSHQIDDFDRVLRSKGYEPDKLERGQTPAVTGRVPLEYVAQYHEPDYRAVTKIALNYIAYQGGHGVVCSPAFDLARRYARFGAADPTNGAKLTVRVYRNRFYEGRKAHYVSVHREAEFLFAQVSLLTRTRFVIGLTNRADEVSFADIAHWFDCDTRRFNSMPVLRDHPGEELPRPSQKGPEVP